MIKILFVIIFAQLLFVLSNTIAKAQVLINEFSSFTSSDWVELYNSNPESVDLSNYLIRDSTETNKVELSGNLVPGGIISFNFSNRLNKDSDTVNLLKLENNTELLVDSIAYGGVNQVCSSGSDSESIGRVVDGGNTIERFKSSSRDGSNLGSELNPCPSPTPLPTSTSTSTPTPKPTATQTPTPTPKPTLTSKPTNSPTPTKSLTNEVTPTTFELDEEELDVSPTGAVKSIQIENPSEVSIDENKSFPTAAVVLVVTGVILIGISVAPILRNLQKKV